MIKPRPKPKSTGKQNKERGSKFEAKLEDSALTQSMAYTRLRDVPHLTTEINMLKNQLRAMGQHVRAGSSAVQPNPCDCIINDRFITVFYEAKSALSELKWADISQYRRPYIESSGGTPSGKKADKSKHFRGKKFNDYWQLHNYTLSGVIVEFCDTGEYYFIPCDKCETMRQGRKTGFCSARAAAHGYKIEEYKPDGKKNLRLDLAGLHDRLYNDYLRQK